MIGLSPTQVKIWFQNHRYKAKKGEKDRNDGEKIQTELTGRGQPRQVLGLMPLSHVKTERTLLAGYAAHDGLPLSSRMSIAAGLQVDNEVGNRRMTDDGATSSPMAGSDDVADNISDISSTGVAKQKTEVAAATGHDDAGAKYFESNGASINMSYFSPNATYSKTQSDSPNKLSSQNLVQFSDQFARLQYHHHQQQQNGGDTSLTELKPIYIGGLGSTAVSASRGEALSLAIADASGGGGGGGYLSGPPGSFGFPPSYYGSAYGSYAAAAAVATEPTASSHVFLADTDRTW